MKNKRKIYLAAFLPCLLTGFFILSEKLSADEISADLIITEIMYDLDGSDTGREWIEIFNASGSKINIPKNSLGLIDEKEERDANGKLKNTCHTFDSDLNMASKEYVIIADNKNDFINDHPDYAGTLSDSVLNLNNTQAGIKISFDRCKTWSAGTSYDKTMGANGNKKTLEFDLDDDIWQESYVNNGTPGIENFTGQDVEVTSPPEESEAYSEKLTLNELLPYPSTDGEEFIELYNPEELPIDLSGWILHDASKSGKYVFPKNTSLESQSYLVIHKKDFKFALNNSGSESVTLYSPDGKTISTIDYKSAKQNISYNFDGKNWRWSKFLTPGAENIFNNFPQVKDEVPEKVYVNTYAEFSAKGSDKDKDNLKYTWDFGDGHKSYLQKTRHKYEKTGEYKVTLKVSDGSEDKIDTFKIEVEKFPKLDVKIISLSPNPDGADTGAEFLNIKNNTKKKINLKNWSIASGTKTLSNHPITEDFFIKDGKAAKITYAVSKFTLPNTKGKIELRYPNGKTASHVSYGDKKKSVAEGATYVKTKSGWKWNIPAVITPAEKEPSPLATPAENNTATGIVEEKIQEEILPTPETAKDLGQSSPSPDWENRQKTRFSFINFGLHISTAQAFAGENPRLQPDYAFENFPARKHWAITLLENLNIKISSFLNKITLAL